MIDQSTLERIATLANLNPAARAEVLAGAVRRSWAPGSSLWEADDEPRGLFFLLGGVVRIVRDDDGRSLLVHTVEAPGESLGEVPLFAGGGYPARAVAATETSCVVVPESCLSKALAADASLERLLLERLARRVRTLVARLGRLARATVAERLRARLGADIEMDGDRLLVRYGSHARLAEELGTAREVVSREIGRLREAGVVGPAGRGVLEVLEPTAFGLDVR